MSSSPAASRPNWFRPAQRRAEYVYADELLLRERRNLARRWWGAFGVGYGIILVLVAVGWWLNGWGVLLRYEVARQFVASIIGIPFAAALTGYAVWNLWIMQRPMRHTTFTPAGRVGTSFKVALGTVQELGWTPWEIDYDHCVIVALAPTGMYEGLPPQVVTIFCSFVSERTSEIRVQSRFVEATRVRDLRRVHGRNVTSFHRVFRELADRAADPNLPMPHPLARLKGRLPEEQLLAIQELGSPRARARLWTIWILITVIAGVILFVQPWLNPWIAWPLTFIAGGGYQFLLANQWAAQEQYALTHATATVIANPFATRTALWERVDGLAAAQKWQLYEDDGSDMRLYAETQPASGYPGTYILFQAIRNDAGIEQLLAVALPEWGLLTALMPTVYAPFQLLAAMQALRRGPAATDTAMLRSVSPVAATSQV